MKYDIEQFSKQYVTKENVRVGMTVTDNEYMGVVSNIDDLANIEIQLHSEGKYYWSLDEKDTNYDKELYHF